MIWRSVPITHRLSCAFSSDRHHSLHCYAEEGPLLVLLLSSWWFFWCVSGKLLVYILLSSLSIHHGGIWLSLLQKERDSLMETAADKERKKELRSLYRRKQRMAAAAIAGAEHRYPCVFKIRAFFGGQSEQSACAA